MKGEPSRTAKLAAAGRALHLFHHGSRALLQDWLAWPLLGAEAEELLALGNAMLGDKTDAFATWFAARVRLSQDWLAAIDCSQHVILGAGLDSSAWREPNGPKVFEVDHPATQEWKRSRAATLDLPEAPVWVPVDFERQTLSAVLADAGVRDQGVFISWHGVIPYLTRDAIAATLDALPPCTLAVSYVPPVGAWDDEIASIGETVQAIAAEAGEPWLSLIPPEEFADLLAGTGFKVQEDVGARDIATRYGLPAINYERIMLTSNRNAS